jgi:hypothetical protein
MAYRRMMTTFSTAQNHIPNPKRKSFKTYQNLTFLQGYTVTKFELKVLSKIPDNLFGRSAKSANIFEIFKKKLSLGVRSQWP